MIANRYCIETEIQRGAFGVIYKGNYKSREHVAIKMDHGPTSTLQHEVKVIQYLYMAGVRNIPSIYWFGNHAERPCVVMSYYECSLYDYHLHKKAATPERLFVLLFKITEIFENIHKHFVLHRDIKPHNFMIKDGDIHLIDFGLAMFYITDEGKHYPDKHSDTMVGSPAFASIHIHDGHRYSRRDDLISLVYLYLFMRGSPFSRGKPLETEYPEIHIQHPANQHLKTQKEYEYVRTIDPSIEYFIKYVYSIKYEETPKYERLKEYFTTPTKQF
jgi:serine/threonine protein kinase